MGVHDDEIAPRGYFPGSKQPLPGDKTEQTQTEQSPQAWDARPLTKIVKGEKVEFFVLGALCAALERPPVTLRLWIRQGVLPEAKYRMPDKNGIRGRRLYTRGQIEAVIRLFEQHNILHTERINWSEHRSLAEEIREAWRDL